MNILSVGSDQKIFEQGSAVRVRTMSYSSFLDAMHVVIFCDRSKVFSDAEEKVHEKVRCYPTYSRSRWFYPIDAVLVGRNILNAHVRRQGSLQEWVLTAQDPFESGAAAMVLSALFHVPFQVQIHTDFFSPHFRESSFLNRVRSLLAGIVLPRASQVRVVSSALKELTHRKYGVSLERIQVLPVFVDVASITSAQPQSLHDQFGAGAIVLMAGRFTAEKNMSVGIRAFQSLLKYRPDSMLLVAGSGILEASLKQEVGNLGIANSVVFLGWQDTMYSLVKGADIFMLTSDFEGYGMVLVEAAAAGVAIVSTDVGIAREYFGSEGAARIAPVGDVDTIAKDLREFASSDAIRTQMGKKAHDIVIRRCAGTLEEYAERQVKLWSEMLTNR